MNAKEFNDYLLSLRACADALQWSEGKSWPEVYKTCFRANWLLWLYARSKGFDNRKFVLAKAKCVMLCKDLLPNDTFKSALDTAIRYGNAEVSKDELERVLRVLLEEQRSVVSRVGKVATACDAVIYTLFHSRVSTAVWDAAKLISETEEQYLDVMNTMSDIVREVIPFEDWDLSNT